MAGGKRTRGPNKQKPWTRTVEDGLSVLRLSLDTSDPLSRDRLEAMFSTAYSIYRAVQRDARHRVRAYRAAHRERARDPAAVRERVGLSRKALEQAAFRHLDAAPHLRRYATKALAMHLADSVWTATERHLFRDARGRTHGMPRIGRWYDFIRIPGRAQSHTEERKWETFRLHGTLAGHRAAYTRPDGRFYQPRHVRNVTSDRWWTYDGPLAVVFTGLPGDPLVLPVRLPSAPSNQPILDHHLSDPSRWHKVDLVRRRDPNADGGWRYEAHLIVLTTPYVGPTTLARRAAAAIDTRGRRAGIDVNVSNLTVASHEQGTDLQITRVTRDANERHRGRRRARQERHRQRALERSRRAANRDQYQLSRRQDKRARRREAAGLRSLEVIPSGPRKARSDGRPLQAYGKDRLSAAYRRGRAAQVRDATSTTQARRDHARRVAGALVRTHGFQLTVEDCELTTWARHWGRALAAFSPGTLVAAIAREATAVAQVAQLTGGVVRASTHTTALSQHCPCGQRVGKSLAERVHACPSCGLRADRDALAAFLGAYVVFEDRRVPSSARVDLAASRAALDARSRTVLAASLASTFLGWQDTLSESNASSARDGWSVAEPGRTPHDVVVARRTVGTALRSTLDETGLRGQTTPERAQTRTNMSRNRGEQPPPLRDTS